MAQARPAEVDDAEGTLVVEKPRFAIVPEWVIDAAICDGAFRLYSQPSGQPSGQPHPNAMEPEPQSQTSTWRCP